MDDLSVVALAGGVGGAKLADGLARCLPPENLTVIVNTGDDFEHFGLKICPDLDTVCYTLARMVNAQTGWGRSGESWHALGSLLQLGGPTWFRLGDRDLATHLERTRRLRCGNSLSQVTSDFCHAWEIRQTVLPMSDDPIPTQVITEEGEMPFQEYFVRRQYRPKVKGFRFEGVEHARAAPGVLEALEQATLVVICPSNPWVSTAPILSVPGVRQIVEKRTVIAISPIIGGQAVRGPAAKMYSEMGIQPSPMAVARHYGSLLSGLVIDHIDAHQASLIRTLGIECLITNILMKTISNRISLAEKLLAFGRQFLAH